MIEHAFSTDMIVFYWCFLWKCIKLTATKKYRLFLINEHSLKEKFVTWFAIMNKFKIGKKVHCVQ